VAGIDDARRFEELHDLSDEPQIAERGRMPPAGLVKKDFLRK
jgi:hypothetical protein